MEKTKKIADILFLCAVLLFYKLFSVNNIYQTLILFILFFLAMPYVYVKYILKEKNFSFGLGIGKWKTGLALSALFLILHFFVLLLFFKYTNIKSHYILPKSVIADFTSFLFYELVYVGGISFVYEFFFRGFVMNRMKKFLGYGSVIGQYCLFLFVAFIFSSNKELWIYFPYIAYAPFAGYMAYKSDSIIYSFITQGVIVLIWDSFIVNYLG